MVSFEERFLAALAKQEKLIKAGYIQSIEKTLEKTDWPAFEQHLDEYQLEQAWNLIKWTDFFPEEYIQAAYEAAGLIAAEEIADVTGATFSMNLANPAAQAWIKDYAASEVAEISTPSKEAIKKVIHNGWQDGVSYKSQTKIIKEMIGLDERRLKWVENYRAKLVENGLPEDKIVSKVNKYSQKLIRKRAETIAVNEASEAGAQSWYYNTKDACQRGVIDISKYQGSRLVTPDEKLCKVCAPLSGERRELPDGAYLSTGSKTSRVHIVCRCIEQLKEREKMKQAVTPVSAPGDCQARVIFDIQKLKEKDGILYVPTVPLVEGVYEQWGLRVFRDYQEFSQYTHWLHGIPVMVNHEDCLDPNARRVGQFFDVTNNDQARKVNTVTRFYQLDLTQRELEQLRTGEPHEGSIRWHCNIIEEQGEWTDPTTGEREQYDFKEVGPYVFLEYSLVTQGVVGTDAGAGFNMQCANCKSKSHAPGGADMEAEQIKEAITEAIKPLVEKNAALEQKVVELEGRQVKTDEQIKAEQKARVFEAFQGKLKPAYAAKAEEHFEAYQKDPAGWTVENIHMFRQTGEGKLRGQEQHGSGALEFNLQAEQDKLFGRAL